METKIPGLKAGHQMITPECRANRGVKASFELAATRLGDMFERYADDTEKNSNVTWHLVLIREEK